jgi:hypothetical protein
MPHCNRLPVLFACAFLAMAGSPPCAHAEGQVTVSLQAPVNVYEGGCPVEVGVTGEITVTDPSVTSVRYQFVRSDGVGSPVTTLQFPKPGSLPVSIETQVGGDFIGWMGIRILAPGENRIAAKASFDVRCTNIESDWSPTFAIAEGYRITEECLPFDREKLTVGEQGGRWKIREGERDLFDFSSRGEAQSALAVIRGYRATHACAAGTGFRYLLAGGHSPAGPPPGVEEAGGSREFDPDRLRVKKLADGWAIVDGETPLFLFGKADVEARKGLAVIRRYRFDQAFRLSPSDPSWYLRKR